MGDDMSNNVRELDKRECVKVVTDNKFITAQGLPDLSLKARKLLYLTIGQARLKDTGFFTYEISPKEFADIMGIDSSNVYDQAFEITSELANSKITFIPDGKKRFKHIPLTSLCEYDEKSLLRIEINPRMAELLLGLKGGFSQPDLEDFMKMKSPFSMAIWHLMSRELKSKKPRITGIKEIELSLDEIREVTGTQKKFERLSQLKEKVFEKALREINENCKVKVTYENIKKGRTVVGFRCSVVSQFYIDESKIPQKVKDRTRLGVLRIEGKRRELTSQEQAEYNRLIKKSEQIELSF